MPDEAPPPPGPPTTPALDRDLYCLTCGYNLRGLSGDPVRCPECGNLNPLGEVEIPAELISRQSRRLRVLPVLCVLVAVAGTSLVASLVWFLWTVSPALPPRAGSLFCCPGAILVGVLLLWGVLVASFRDSCQGKPGWSVALAKYHLYGLFWLSLLGSLIGAVGWVTWHFLGEPAGRMEFAVLLIGVVTVLCVTLTWATHSFLRRWHRRLFATFGALQRQVAIDTARRELESKL